jgi:predicted nucleic acid-binding Zn ribbon protein
MSDRRFENLSTVLNRVVRGLDIEEELRSHAIEPAWPRAVGERIAANTRPARLVSGTLWIEARSAAWLNEVSLLRRGLMAALNREMGGDYVRDVRFRLGGGFPALTATVKERRPAATEEEIRTAEVELARAGAHEGASIAARAMALSRRKDRA